MSLLHKTALLIAFIFILPLSGCGFSPVYGTNSDKDTGAKHLLARTEISIIPDQEGVYLRNELIDSFYLYGRPQNPLYKLNFSTLEQTLTDLDITKTSESTRRQLKLGTTIKLIRTSDGQEVLKRKMTVVTSYNILESEFTNRISRQDALRDALEDLANQVEIQVSLYFNRIQ